MIDLDDRQVYEAMDPGGMLRKIAELPRQCEDAWKTAGATSFPSIPNRIENIVILGMGGSAIGGDLARTLVQDECAAPIIVNRDYTLPAFVGDHTLLIASSYSGNTEETLITLEQALSVNATLVAIAGGGKLAERSAEVGAPVLPIAYESQPRAALGYSLILTLGVLQAYGLIADQSAHIQQSVGIMAELQAEINERIPESRNAAKQLATRLYGRVPIVYGSGYLSTVARRWKGQLNENAKNAAFFEEMPELNHNAVVGYEWPEEVAQQILIVMLRCSLDHPRNGVRFEVTEEILKMRRVPYEIVQSRGTGALTNVLSAVHMGDYVSYYLALLNGADPTPVDAIGYLKGRLVERFSVP